MPKLVDIGLMDREARIGFFLEIFGFLWMCRISWRFLDPLIPPESCYYKILYLYLYLYIYIYFFFFPKIRFKDNGEMFLDDYFET